jgi:hypothetical protein
MSKNVSCQSLYIRKWKPAEMCARQCLDGQIRSSASQGRCSVLSFFGEWFTSTLGTCASSLMTTHVVLIHAWWGTISFFFNSVRQHLNQTFSEQCVGSGGRVNWPARSLGFNSLDFWLLIQDFGVYSAIQWLRGITATSRECLSEYSTEFAPLCDEELKVVFKCMTATYRIFSRGNMNIAHISAGIRFWTCLPKWICSFNWALYPHAVTLSARCKSWTVFACSDAGIVGSNPTQGMDVWCVYKFILCLCCLRLGSGLTTN